MFDVCFIGHVTRDRIEIAGAPVRVQPGGSAYYGGLTAARLGLRTAAVSKMHRADRPLLLSGMEAAGIHLRVADAPATTTYVNAVSGDDLDERTQKVLAVALPFQPGDVDVGAAAYVFGPLTHDELPAACVARAAATGRVVAMDVQGLLRRVRGERVVLVRSAAALRMLGRVTILKASREEAALLTGEPTVEGAARALTAAGPREVLVTSGVAGSLVLAGGDLFTVPAYAPPEVVDTTGCGDTYLAAYLACRLGGGVPEEAGHFASRVAGAKTAYHGAYRGEAPALRPVEPAGLEAE